MTDEEYLRKNLSVMQGKLTLKECMAISWALAEIDELRPNSVAADAMKLRAAAKIAEEEKISAALLNYQQRLEETESDRDDLRRRLDEVKRKIADMNLIIDQALEMSVRK